MAKQAMRTRYHSLITYCEPTQINTVWRTYNHRLIGIAYILHDKDKNDDGSPKEPHRHVIVRTVTSVSTDTVRTWFKRFQFTDAKGQAINTMGEPVLYANLGAVVDYLIHLNNPEKHQYDKADIVKLGDCRFLRAASATIDESLEIIDKLNNGLYPLRQMVAEYGRDFIYHYRAYRDMAALISIQENKMLELGLMGAPYTDILPDDNPQLEECRRVLYKAYDYFLENMKVKEEKGEKIE